MFHNHSSFIELFSNKVAVFWPCSTFRFFTSFTTLVLQYYIKLIISLSSLVSQVIVFDDVHISVLRVILFEIHQIPVAPEAVVCELILVFCTSSSTRSVLPTTSKLTYVVKTSPVAYIAAQCSRSGAPLFNVAFFLSTFWEYIKS